MQTTRELNEQESFWAGAFGDDYIDRNRGERIIRCNAALFAKVISRTGTLESVIEFGANIGLNLRAIRQLLPSARFSAVEINAKAARELRTLPGVTVHHQPILDFQPLKQHDMVLVKTVLIHQPPTQLPMIYDLLHRSAGRFICLAEYYNPTPVEVTYRGHRDRMFKRDFAGELLDRFGDLRLIDYGFVYHRDTMPQDDLNWFLLGRV